SRSAGARSGYEQNARVVGWRNAAARAGWPSWRRPTADSAHLAAHSRRRWRTRAGGQRSHQPAGIVTRQVQDPFRGSSSMSTAKIPLDLIDQPLTVAGSNDLDAFFPRPMGIGVYDDEASLAKQN